MNDCAVCQHKSLRSRCHGFPKAKSRITVVTLALLALFVAGCPAMWNNVASEKTASADQLFKNAEDHFQKKEYVEAVEVYDTLLSAYPDFKDAPQVHLKVGDAFFNNGSYDKATARYSQFVELYPADKEVPRAKFQMAMGNYKQIKSIDRDSSIIQAAAENFKRLADDPNGGEWSKKAQEYYRRCRQKLGQKELYKARTYISTSNYQAARLAVRRVLDEYSNLGLDEEANTLLKKIKNK